VAVEQLGFGDDAREEIRRGVDTGADAMLAEMAGGARPAF
jgi:hypothetical protein